MTTAADASSGKTHRDENFPVASRLIEARHRPAILAFYRFVRAADDVSDNADLPPDEKLRLLDRLGDALDGRGAPEAEAEPLRRVLAERGLTARHAHDLLDAFRQDVRKLRYDDWDDLIGYCRLSAMPVGRYVLDVHGESQATWPANDALCAALQVINHLQDCGKDFTTLNRVYLPQNIMARHGARVEDLAAPQASPGLRATIRDCAERTDRLLNDSAAFFDGIANTRLALEVAAIQRLAEVLTGWLKERNPLSDTVHLGKLGAGRAALFGIGRALGRRLLGSRQHGEKAAA